MASTPRSLALRIALLAALALTVAAPVAGARAKAPAEPSRGALLGAWVDRDSPGGYQQDVVAFERQAGRRLDLGMRYRRFGDTLVGSSERWLRDRGTTPIVTWEPFDTSLARIASGKEDAVIRASAREVRAFGAPVLIRFAHEMNGNWYPWSGVANRKGADPASGAKLYRRAWQRIWRIFRAEGARNAAWVWCPNWRSYPQVRGNAITNFYPGDAYVDWVCVDAYNFGRNRASGTTYRDLARMLQPIIATYGRKKPIMIGETASVEARGGDKATWITRARAAVRRYPAVRAVVWFDEAKRGNPWPIDSSRRALSAFRTWASDPYFNQRAGRMPTVVGTVDLPAVAFADAPGAGARLREQPPAVAFSASGDEVECLLVAPDGSTTRSAPCSSPVATPDRGPGRYTLTVTATRAGSHVAAVASWQLVAPAPTVALTAGPARGETGTIGDVAFAFAADGHGASVATTCQLFRSGDERGAFVPCDGGFAAAGLVPGTWVFTVKASSEGGTATASVWWRVVPAPVEPAPEAGAPPAEAPPAEEPPAPDAPPAA